MNKDENNSEDDLEVDLKKEGNASNADSDTEKNDRISDDDSEMEENSAQSSQESEGDGEASAEDELTKVKELAKANEDKFLRTLAEFDNFRKRTSLEKAAMYDNGVRDTIEKILSVYDNFERAVTYATDDEKNTSLYKGVEMIYEQFTSMLEGSGVKEVPGEGEPFDPNVHNAVMHIEDDSLGENVIVQVLQKGYTYNDRVIRPAMVKVAN